METIDNKSRIDGARPAAPAVLGMWKQIFTETIEGVFCIHDSTENEDQIQLTPEEREYVVKNVRNLREVYPDRHFQVRISRGSWKDVQYGVAGMSHALRLIATSVPDLKCTMHWFGPDVKETK